MATSLHSITLSLLFSLYISLPSTHSHYTSTMLDVHGSIQKTLHFQNPNTNPNTTTLYPSPNKSTSYLSFRIHSRASLSRPENYTSFIFSRLVRDSVRVDSVKRRVDSPLSVPVTSGQGEGSGEYFAWVGIGRPVRSYYWVIDTGSDVTWLQCLPCVSCYPQSDPVYNPVESSTYTPLSCESTQCRALDESACLDDMCQYKVSYGDGSFTIGDFGMDTLSFGSSGSVENIALGCGHANMGLFAFAAGLIGLGGGSLSLPSQLQAESFSYCLVDGDSTNSSTLDFNSGKINGSVTTSLVHNPRILTYRYIDLVGMSVGGRRLAISLSIFAVDASGHGGTILDSGTSVTRLRTPAYNTLRDEFVRQAKDLKRTSSGYELLDTCYEFKNNVQVAIPTVSFEFQGNQSLTIPPEGVLIPVDSNGKFCLAFASTDMELSIIGNIQQQTTRVYYDLFNSIVEFKPKSC